MTIAANFGIRWLAVAAGMGPESIFFWCLGALLFFLPLALIAAHLSRKFPEEGGLYAWIKLALGEKAAFMVAWLYLINGVFFYPAVLIFFTTNFTYFLGHPELAQHPLFMTASVIIAFWLIVLISFFGLKTSKTLINFGGIFGTIVPVCLLIIFAVIALFIYKHSATQFSAKALLPSSSIFSSLSSLSIIMFAMAGIEVIPTFAQSVKNPKRDLYLGLLIGALLIFFFYTLGTLAINVIATPAEISNTSGLMQSFEIINTKLHMSWLTRPLAFMLTFSDLAAVIVWLIAPVIIFFSCTPKGILPPWFHKMNKHGSPGNALIFMGVLVSIIIILTNLVPGINNMYQVLVLMATILYFIPYLYLALAYIKLRRKLDLHSGLIYLIGVLVFASVCLGIIFSFAPPADLTNHRDIVIYEAELVLGPALFIFAGWALYKWRKA